MASSAKDFNALKMVDRDSLTFGATGDEDTLAFCNPKGEYINGDRLKDLVCRFYTENTEFLCGDTEGVLKGMTTDGTPIEGSDSVRIVPCKKWQKPLGQWGRVTNGSAFCSRTCHHAASHFWFGGACGVEEQPPEVAKCTACLAGEILKRREICATPMIDDLEPTEDFHPM